MLKVVILVSVANFAASQDVESFIVGGKPTTIQEYSHVAYIIVHSYPMSFVCGSSILNQNIILTAAHCFEDVNSKPTPKVSVRAGSAHKLKGAVRYVGKVCVHENYNPNTVENDIALAYIKKPFLFSEYIKRVVLMKDHPIYNSGYVAGWGVINEFKHTSTNLLHRAKQTLWSRDECRKILRRMPKGVLCGGIKHGKEYAAEGDSGSALVVNGYIQIGLVSFKRPEISKSLVVYTDVSYFYNWIETNSRMVYCY